MVFRDMVAPKLSEIRSNYVTESRRLLAANRSSDEIQADVRAVAPLVANDGESDEDDSGDEGHYHDTDDELEEQAVQGVGRS